MTKKTCMIVGTRESPELSIVIDNNKIKQVHNKKVLGIDSDEFTLDSIY